MTAADQAAPEPGLSNSELELLRQLIVALRSFRYGSVLLIVHDGQVVEIQKTEKIRMRTSQP